MNKKKQCVLNLLAFFKADFFSFRDLFTAISQKEFPSWTMYIQVMTFEQAEKWEFNPFDVTKVGIWRLI